MGHYAFLARPHLESLETQDAAHHLYEGHLARQFMDGIDLRAVHIFIRVILQQVTISLDAELVAQHLLPIWAYARQILDVLL